MEQKLLRTYQRRSTTRESGFHTCDETTGGECYVKFAQKITLKNGTISLKFHREKIDLVELFDKGIAILGFGGYIFSNEKATLNIRIDFVYEGECYSYALNEKITLDKNEWKNIGYHVEIPLNKDSAIFNANVSLDVDSKNDAELNFICFDFNIVKKDEFLDDTCAKSFYQKTALHIPYLYYFDWDLPITKYLVGNIEFQKGKRVVLKSCNRCGRFLPINIDDELKTLSFSLHCKKRAPCIHTTFRAYEILNRAELSTDDLSGLKLEGNKIVSYYGHQLECKACKKFFVNAPLNPQRNAQQFKEDGLRRRAIEVLINQLLNKNLIHFEFKRKTKKEFSRYIWEKFNKRCFKCGPSSEPIALEDMALDHTMPLAYLYRLDETATCLCSSHNSQKRDHFPVEYYKDDELKELSRITGIPYEKITTKSINMEVLNLLVENIVWFYDVFLMNPDYQKIRDGILTADKINDSLKRVIAGKVDLAEEYKKRVGKYPTSITIK